jgi:hypothetical protein
MNLSRQYNIPSIGRFVHLTYQTLPMLSIMANFFSVGAFYGIWKEGILIYLPWLTLPVFILFLFGLVVVLMILNRMLIYRGYYDFQNTQQFPEDGPVMQAIRKAVREEIRAEMNKKHD